MIPRPTKNELAAVDAMIWIYNHERESQYFSCCRKVRNMIVGGEFIGLILPTASSLPTASDLCRKYNLKRKQWYDAVLAATLLNDGVHVLYTMNEKDFLPIAELSLINPFTETLRYGSLPAEWGIQPSEIPPKTAGDTSADDDIKPEN